jgi:glycosyltransferase involved in cell wall biosynthesis
MNSIHFLVFGRFPTEKAYGGHLISNAKSFVENGYKVNVYYPSTNNSKTIDLDPNEYYSISDNINFTEIRHRDITGTAVYNYLPKIIQSLLWSISGIFWAIKVKRDRENQPAVLWSTNPNLLLFSSYSNDPLIVELHGAARYIQRISLKCITIYRRKHIFVATTESILDYAQNLTEYSLHLPNAVDSRIFKPSRKKNNKITFGYVGMFETYGVEKGIYATIDIFSKVLETTDDFELVIMGGPDELLSKYKQYVENLPIKSKITFVPYGTQQDAADKMSKLDVGLVPYPKSKHMTDFSSPLKFHEYASSGCAIIASDIKPNKEVEKQGYSISYYSSGSEYEQRILDFIKGKDSLVEDSEVNLETAEKNSWNKRTDTVINKLKRL